MIIENIIFDMTEGFIPYQDDPYNVRKLREKV